MGLGLLGLTAVGCRGGSDTDDPGTSSEQTSAPDPTPAPAGTPGNDDPNISPTPDDASPAATPSAATAEPVPLKTAEVAPPPTTRATTDPALAELPDKVRAFVDWQADVPGYIQTDKPLYKPGESVWYRAWWVDAHNLSARGDYATLELVGPRGTVLESVMVANDTGVVANAFDLPADAAGGQYTLRSKRPTGQTVERTFVVAAFEPPKVKKNLEFQRKAYGPGDRVEADLTLQRLDDSPMADQTVSGVVRLDGQTLAPVEATTDASGKATLSFELPAKIEAGDGVLTVSVDDGGLVESITRRVPITLQALRVDLRPEGGDLVEGLTSRVYFEARTPLDEPADIEAEIVDDTGTVVTTARSHHFGLGRFELTPQPGRSYHLRVTRPTGIAGTHDLPTAKDDGCVLRTFDDLDSVEAAVRVQVACTQAQQVGVVGTLRERVYDAATVEVTPDTPAVVHLASQDPVLTRAQGLMRVTAFDGDQQPVAERLVFRNRRGGIQVELVPDQDAYQPRDEVTLQVRTTNPDGEPLAADLALSVVDDTVVNLADDRESDHLLSAMLLHELAGDLDEPTFFFDPTEDKAALALELAVGVRGWRRFEWTPVFAVDPSTADTSTDDDKDGGWGDILVHTGQGQNLGLGMIGAGRGGGGAGRGFGAGVGRLEGVGDAFADEAPEEPVAVELEADEAAPVMPAAPVPDAAAPDVAADLADLEAGDEPAAVEPLEEEAVGLLREMRAEKPKPIERVPRLRQGNAVVTGALDKNLVRRVTRQHHNELKNCYAQALQRDASLQGKLAVDWTIDASGNVAAVAVSDDTLGDPTLGQCVSTAVKGWRFPAPRGGGLVKVSYPFMFDAEEQQRAVANSWAPARVFPVPERGADDAPAGKRRDLRQTVYWNPAVRTDEKGVATVTFPLSDAVTSFRATAEGTGGFGLLGRTEHVLSSQLPLSVDLKLPVEVSAGDHLVLPIVLRNARNQKVTADVRLQLGDLVEADAAAMPSLTDIELAAGQTRTLYVPVDVKNGRGANLVAIEARAGEVVDRFERRLRVVPPGFPRTQTASGTLTETATATVDIDSPLPGSIEAAVVIQPSPAAMMQSAVESMLREPHGCFEQTSSATYPNILALDFLSRTNLADPDLRKRAEGLIATGYDRLVGYEVDGGGFEWFGSPPAHEALTAYGVLEFTEMRRVMPELVDDAMIRRTTDWLLTRRDGQGGYTLDSKALDSFGRAPAEVTAAYITYALLASGQVDAAALKTELDALQKTAEADLADPYRLALTVLALSSDPQRAAAAAAQAKRLAGLQGDAGVFTGSASSITSSSGRNLDIESTSLAVLAMLAVDAEAHGPAIGRAVQWLSSQSDGLGGYGSTQATILALRALVEVWTRKPGEDATELAAEVLVDGQVAGEASWTAGQLEPVKIDLSQALSAGQHTIELRSKSGALGSLPWGLRVRHHTAGGTDIGAGAVALTTELAADGEVAMGDSVRMTAVVRNTTQEPLAMTVARLAVPGGTELQLWQLDELKDQATVDFYETGPRELVVYFEGLAAGESRTIPIELTATVPGRFEALASAAWLYYDDDQRSWARGATIEIATP